MELQLADKHGKQIKSLKGLLFEAELNGGDRTFLMTVPFNKWDKRLSYGCRLFVANTEIGGIVGCVQTDTSTNTISVSGYGWRGLLARKIIIPPTGSDYYIVSGELNSILRKMIEPAFGGFFLVPDKDTGVVLSGYKFDRFCTMLDGIEKMLESVGYRIQISYIQGEPNGTGWLEVSAEQIHDYSEEVMLSQDSRLNFTMEEKQDGINHLVIGGKGELQERNVIHLFVQADGTIGQEQYYTGIDERVEFYENTSTDTVELEEAGKKELQKIMNSKSFDMTVESLDKDVQIGDVVGGCDFITGMSMKKPIENIIVKYNGYRFEKDYKLKGAN